MVYEFVYFNNIFDNNILFLLMFVHSNAILHVRLELETLASSLFALVLVFPPNDSHFKTSVGKRRKFVINFEIFLKLTPRVSPKCTILQG